MNEQAANQVLHIFSDTLYTNPELPNSLLILRGYYAKRILIVVKSDDFSPKDDELLTKMLQACQLKEDDYYIVAASSSKGLHAFVALQNPDTLLLFGLDLDTDMIKLNKPFYKPFRFNNVKILISDALPKLQLDASLKSLLWTNGLKPLFKI
jgi:hypothetical protein